MFGMTQDGSFKLQLSCVELNLFPTRLTLLFSRL